MVLTPQEQAQLDALAAKASQPEPRTDKGIVGVLHTLIDLAAGRVAHLAPEAVDQLHTQAEYNGDRPDPDPDPTSPGPGPGSGI